MFKRGREGERERGREGERERGREGLEVNFIFLFLGCLSEPNDDCQVMEVASNTTKKCIFPFWHEGDYKHDGCIADDDPNFVGKFWCPTEVDSNDKHIIGGGFWGHCGQNCYIEKKSKGELSLSWPDLTLSYLT